jgi:hypothetical protein
MIEILVLFEVELGAIRRKWILKGVRLRKGKRRIFESNKFRDIKIKTNQ